MQAKTTKKIVLRLQCNVCKAVHMHAIKVRRAGHVGCPAVLLLSLPNGRALLIQSFSVSRTCADHSIVRVQRCKHFEIGGEKKHKSQVY